MEVGTRASTRPTKQAVGILAVPVLSTVNFAVVSTWGVECGITDLEQKLAIPSLQRMFERMPAGAAQRASWIIDPVVLITVMVLWGKRIAAIQHAKTVEKYAIDPVEQARSVGVTGYTYNAPNPTTNGTAPPQAPAPAEGGEASTTGNGVPPEIRSGFDANF